MEEPQMTIHDLPPLSVMTDAQLSALLDWRPSIAGHDTRPLLECAFHNAMQLGRITEQDVARVLA
jgi:hypothetical protein